MVNAVGGHTSPYPASGADRDRSGGRLRLGSTGTRKRRLSDGGTPGLFQGYRRPPINGAHSRGHAERRAQGTMRMTTIACRLSLFALQQKLWGRRKFPAQWIAPLRDGSAESRWYPPQVCI